MRLMYRMLMLCENKRKTEELQEIMFYLDRDDTLETSMSKTK